MEIQKCRKEWGPLERLNINEYWLNKNDSNIEYKIYIELKYMATIMEK